MAIAGFKIRYLKHPEKMMLYILYLCGVVVTVTGVLPAYGVPRPCNPQVVGDSLVLSLFDPLSAEIDSNSEYAICLDNSKPPLLILFRDGTQVKGLDSTLADTFFALHPALREKLSAQRVGRVNDDNSGDRFFRDKLFNTDLDRNERIELILNLGAWPVGLAVSKGVGLGGSNVTILSNSIRFEGMGRFRHLYFGAGLKRDWCHGSLVDQLFSDAQNNYRNHSFSFTLGLPFLRYEIKQAGWILPEFFWLEDDIIAVLEHRTAPVTVAQIPIQWDKSHKRNWEHQLYSKIGHVRFTMLFDSEMYGRAIVQLSVDELPSGLGTWGASLTRAADVWVPGAWLHLPAFQISLFSEKDFEVPVHIGPLHLYFHYWNLRRFNLGGTMVVHFGLNKNH